MSAARRGSAEPPSTASPSGTSPEVSPEASPEVVAEALLRWFAAARRELPWRRQRTPYRVWLSEVMLQQTRVATVVPYFQRFVEAFPDPAALAAAPLDAVLKAWEGLGYYRRARLLHRAAGELQARGGELPRTEAELRELPGFGPYTAAAVAAIAFGEPVVAVDGNVRRVASRLFALERPGLRRVRERLEPLLPPEAPGDFNEALMELGALLCTPRAPRCASCPLAASCRAHAAGDPERFPGDPPRGRTPTRRRYALVHARGGRLWLRQRGADELLPGLWGFPQCDAPPPEGARPPEPVEVRHAYTHFKLHLVAVPTPAAPVGSHPLTAAQLDELALSRVDRKLLAALRDAGWLAAPPG